MLQRTEDGISVDSKKFTGEKIEMVSRLSLCGQSSCVYHSRIPEEQSNRISVELLADPGFREKNAEKMAESAGRMCEWENELYN